MLIEWGESLENMNIEEQIKELNEEIRCHIKPSSIHGIGVFALRDIKKGEKLYLVPNRVPKWYSIPFDKLDELRPEIKEVVLARWPSIVNGSMFRSPLDDVWMASFINHGGNNSNYDIDHDVALIDIPIFTEVLEDYTKMSNYDKVYVWLKENKDSKKDIQVFNERK